ncbi:MAG: DUF3883 domain-containing protein [Cytophagales bacterium]|nr:DUF3883 domain-containing protein [Cytophagales bacterium]
MKEFENLKYKQLKTLLDVVNDVKENSIEVIRRRYNSSADNFKGASNFLKELKILTECKDKLVVKSTFRTSVNGVLGDETLKGLLLKELLSTKSKLADDVRSYLEKYGAGKGNFEYKPLTSVRVQESPLRNFLMDLGLIEYNRMTGTYKIREEHFESFELFLQQKKLTIKELTIILKRKEDLGKAAELKILEYEKRRLADCPELIEKLEHISVDNVKAGYDILSWEKESKNGRPVERYVEVKAVSRIDYGFYWTRNEVEKAKKYSNQYCLYLLPVIGKKKFDIGGLEIIPNPIDNVFDNIRLWNKEVETYTFYKASFK